MSGFITTSATGYAIGLIVIDQALHKCSYMCRFHFCMEVLKWNKKTKKANLIPILDS